MRKYCANCRFSIEDESSFKGYDTMCMRYARYPIHKRVMLLKTDIEFLYPRVNKHDVCGEWRPDKDQLRRQT